LPCIIEDGVAKLPDRSAFAGSIATTDLLIRTMVNIANIPLLDAVNMITINPLKMLNLNVKKGRIQEGCDADLVLFDKDINVKKVFIKGNIVKGN
jgi:N-acetylglucosamine-6-phosphate deacetylase